MKHKYLCQLVIFAMIISALSPAAAQSDGAGVARLWRVSYSGDASGTIIYILAISHEGSALEYDGYLDATVVPAFMASDVLHFEDGGKLATNQQPECRRRLSSPAGVATLKQARAMVGRGADAYFRQLATLLPPPAADPERIRSNAAAFTRSLSEFSVVQTLRAQFVYLQAHDAPGAPATPYPYRPIVEYLRQLKPGVAVESMDAPMDLVDAYCSAGEKRSGIISEYMKTYDLDLLQKAPAETGEAIARKIDEKIRAALAGESIELDLYESAMTCTRTHRWEQRFKNLFDGKTHFLALGAAHLFPSTGPVTACPGLFQDLRQSGFMVEKVR